MAFFERTILDAIKKRNELKNCPDYDISGFLEKEHGEYKRVDMSPGLEKLMRESKTIGHIDRGLFQLVHADPFAGRTKPAPLFMGPVIIHPIVSTGNLDSYDEILKLLDLEPVKMVMSMDLVSQVLIGEDEIFKSIRQKADLKNSYMLFLIEYEYELFVLRCKLRSGGKLSYFPAHLVFMPSDDISYLIAPNK